MPASAAASGVSSGAAPSSTPSMAIIASLDTILSATPPVLPGANVSAPSSSTLGKTPVANPSSTPKID